MICVGQGGIYRCHGYVAGSAFVAQGGLTANT